MPKSSATKRIVEVMSSVFARDGVVSTVESVTRTLACDTDSLIVRQLKRPEGDRVFLKTLPVAAKLSKRIAA